MGMYTELVLSFELKKDTPDEIINTLIYMIEDKYVGELDVYFLDKASRLKWMLRSYSYYFNYSASLSDIDYDKITRTHSVSIRCSLKNYENEINLFLYWVAPYIYEYRHDFIGYTLYENANEPTLIYLGDYL